ncbi:MAG: metallo-mystery pair system four-Cys motif protein [Myxococcales bacterium]|nr:metallo-mystery pair system four-Cys motif protein [Myxococcales bacterium]
MMLLALACSDGSRAGKADAGSGGASSSGAIRDAAAPVFFTPDAEVLADEGEGFVLEVPDASVAMAEEEAEVDALAGLSPIELHFDVRVGEQSLRCGERFGPIGEDGLQAELLHLRFYLHDLYLIGADGKGQEITLAEDGRFQHDGVALLDFEDGSGRCEESGNVSENHRIVGGVPAGNYVGLAFKVGVPEAYNHEDPTEAAPPLDLLPMHWSWADGYKFLRIDAREQGGTSFNIHLGSTYCNFDESLGRVRCERANRAEVVFKAFDPARERVVLDYGTLLEGIDVVAETPGCIAGGTPWICQPLMAAFGIDHATGTADPELQRAFFAEER